MGYRAITNVLQKEGIRPWSSNAKTWNGDYVNRLLSDRRLLGEHQRTTLVKEDGKRKRVQGELLRDYYPKVIGDELFARVQAVRSVTRGARFKPSKKEDRAESPNIFAGFLEPESGCSWTYRRDLKIDKLGNRKTNDDQ